MKKNVNKKGEGKIKNAKALSYKGIEFKSKLEMFTYMKLIEAGITNFKYEEDKFTLLEPFQYNNESIEVTKDKQFVAISNNIRATTYLPDFTCIDPNGKGWIIECKGYANDAFPIKWKRFKEYLVNNGYDITLYKPNNQQNVLKTITMIKEKFYNG